MKWTQDDPKTPSTNFKIIFIGDSTVGKTSIIHRYLNNSFTKQMDSTIGASFSCARKEKNDGSGVKLHIWDTAGQERFRSIINLYYRGADAVVLVCDLTNQSSIDSLEHWIADFYDRTNNPDAKFILVGNKVDLLQRREGTEDVTIPKKLQDISREKNLPLIISSALNGENIEHIFETAFNNLENEIPFEIKDKEANETMALQKHSKIYVNLIEKPLNHLSGWCNIL